MRVETDLRAALGELLDGSSVTPPPASSIHRRAQRQARTQMAIGSTLVLALVAAGAIGAIAFVRPQSTNLAAAPPAAAPISTAASISSTFPPGTPTPAALTLSAATSTVGIDQPITINVSFSGDPSQVESTALIINGLPSLETSQGLRNSFTLPGTNIPGSQEYKVSIGMKDGRSIESNTTTVTIDPSLTIPPPPPVPGTDTGYATEDVLARVATEQSAEKTTVYRAGNPIYVECQTDGGTIVDGDTGRTSDLWYQVSGAYVSALYVRLSDSIPFC